MRIAIVINTSWNIYNFRRGLVESLLKEGHEVWAIAPEDEYVSALKELGCHYHPLKMNNKGSNPLQDLGTLVQLTKIFRKVRPDAVLLYTIKPNLYGSIAAKLCGIPSLCNVSGLGTVFLHKGLTASIAKGLYRFAFRFPYKIFFQNPDDRELFLGLKLVAATKTALLPGSGVDLEKFKPLPFEKRTPFTFLMVARLLYDKGIMEYLNAALQLKNENLEVRCLIAGAIDTSGGLGISKEELQPWLDKGIVELLPFTDTIKQYYEMADVVVLPSYREGTPKTLLEAAAMGIPLVATNAPGCREIVEEEYNGFLCLVRSSDALATAMKRMLSLNESELRQMGRNSRLKTEKEFDQHIIIDAYLSVLKALPIK
jgi:glycosyltransferase involved in cell wall biosynthesis